MILFTMRMMYIKIFWTCAVMMQMISHVADVSQGVRLVHGRQRRIRIRTKSRGPAPRDQAKSSTHSLVQVQQGVRPIYPSGRRYELRRRIIRDINMLVSTVLIVPAALLYLVRYRASRPSYVIVPAALVLYLVYHHFFRMVCIASTITPILVIYGGLIGGIVFPTVAILLLLFPCLFATVEIYLVLAGIIVLPMVAILLLCGLCIFFT